LTDINVYVKGSQGQVISGAKVEVQQDIWLQGYQTVASGLTDTSGYYKFVGQGYTKYRISASKLGYKSDDQTVNTDMWGTAVRVDLVLPIGLQAPWESGVGIEYSKIATIGVIAVVGILGMVGLAYGVEKFAGIFHKVKAKAKTVHRKVRAKIG